MLPRVTKAESANSSKGEHEMHGISTGQEGEAILGDVIVCITGYGVSHSCLSTEPNKQGVITQLRAIVRIPMLSSLHPPTLQHNRTPLPPPHRWIPDEQAQQCDCEGEWWHFSVHIASMPMREGKVKLAMWDGGGKSHQRSRVLPQKEIIWPRKEWRLHCLSFLRGN